MIEVTSFDILTLVNSSHFFFFLRGSSCLITRVMGPLTLDFIFIGLSLSHDPDRGFSGIT